MGRTYSQAMLIVTSVAIMATALGIVVLYGPDYLYVSIAILTALLSLLRPGWALMGYLALSATLPSSEGVDNREIATFGLLMWLFLLANLHWIINPPADRRLRSLIVTTDIFFLTTLVSLGIALTNDLTFTDWARDLVPLSNLSLLVVMPTLVRHPKDVRIMIWLFVGVFALVGFHSAWTLLGEILPGRPYFNIPFRIGGTWLPVLLIVAGFVGMAESDRVDWRFVGLGAIGIVTTVLTNTRTVWISSTLAIGLVLLSNITNRRISLKGNGAILLLPALLAGGIIAVMYAPGNEEVLERHQSRFETLKDLGSDQSYQIRQSQIREAMAIFRERPVFGIGLGYLYEYKEYAQRYDQPNNFNHCDPANYLAKMGIVGTAALYFLLLSAIAFAGRLKKRSPDLLQRWLAGFSQIGIAASLVVGYSTPVLQSRETTFCLGVLLGLLATTVAQAQVSEAAQEPHETVAEQLASA